MTLRATPSIAHKPPAVRALTMLLFAAMAGVGDACAQPAAATEAPTVEPTREVIETARAQAQALSMRLARGVDSWFGDRPFEDGGRVSNGLLSLGVFHRQDQGTDVDVRFTARFRLPNFEKSAYLFAGRDDPRDTVRDTPESINRQQPLRAPRPEDRSFLGGLGGALGDELNFRLGVSARLQPFVQLRWDKPWELAPGQVLGFRETLFWSRAERFGATTALSYELQLNPAWALRWQAAATITQDSRNVEWSSSAGVWRDFGQQKALSAELLFSGTGTQGRGVGMSDRGVLVRWQQPLYRDWLLGELAAGQFWLRPDAQSPRGRAWALGYSLKMGF